MVFPCWSSRTCIGDVKDGVRQLPIATKIAIAAKERGKKDFFSFKTEKTKSRHCSSYGQQTRPSNPDTWGTNDSPATQLGWRGRLEMSKDTRKMVSGRL